jgi:hypothetical protein
MATCTISSRMKTKIRLIVRVRADRLGGGLIGKDFQLRAVYFRTDRQTDMSRDATLGGGGGGGGD